MGLRWEFAYPSGTRVSASLRSPGGEVFNGSTPPSYDHLSERTPVRRRRVRRGVAALAVCALPFAGGPGSAAAAEYPINNCFADLDTHSSQAFEDFATRGMMWKRACNPEGRGRRGLVTGNVIRSGRVRRGARSYFILRAPAGTRFGRFTWSGQARRRDCRYALQVWASRPDGPTVPIKNVRANEKCPRRGNAQAAGWPKRRTKDVSGSNKIVQRIICVGTNRTPYCSSRGENYIRTLVASATVVDVSPPAIRIIQNNPFTLGQWVSGNQTVSYDTSDNVGVRLAQAVVGGLVQAGHEQRPCNFTQAHPVSERSGRDCRTTTLLTEGSQALRPSGDSTPQETSAARAGVTVRVDNTRARGGARRCRRILGLAKPERLRPDLDQSSGDRSCADYQRVLSPL